MVVESRVEERWMHSTVMSPEGDDGLSCQVLECAALSPVYRMLGDLTEVVY